MGLKRPEDRALYARWVKAIAPFTDGEVAERMGMSERGIAKLRAEEPTRLENRTRKLMRQLLGEPDPATMVRERPAIPYAATKSQPVLPESVRIWIQEFLLRLTKAGATEDEVDEARLLLTRSDVLSYASRMHDEPLGEKERLQLVKAIAAAAIIPTLRKAGRKVDASFAR